MINIAYTTSTLFQNRFGHRTVATFPGTSDFNQMVTEFSAEINRFLDTTADICTSSDNTMESNNIVGIMNALIEENLKYIEKNLTPSSNENTTVMAPPSLFDQQHAHFRERLSREKREEKARAFSYNLRTGQIRRWYG